MLLLSKNKNLFLMDFIAVVWYIFGTICKYNLN